MASKMAGSGAERRTGGRRACPQGAGRQGKGLHSRRSALNTLSVGACFAIDAEVSANSASSGAGVAWGAAVAISILARGTQWAELEVAHHDAVAAKLACLTHIHSPLVVILGEAGSSHWHGIASAGQVG